MVTRTILHTPGEKRGAFTNSLPFSNKQREGCFEILLRYGSTRNDSLSLLFLTLLLLPMQAMDLYTAVMLRIFNDRAHQMSARMIKGDGHAYVPLDAVAPVVEDLLPVMDEVRQKRPRTRGSTCQRAQNQSMAPLSRTQAECMFRGVHYIPCFPSCRRVAALTEFRSFSPVCAISVREAYTRVSAFKFTLVGHPLYFQEENVHPIVFTFLYRASTSSIVAMSSSAQWINRIKCGP